MCRGTGWARCWMFARVAQESRGLMFLFQLQIISPGARMKRFTSSRLRRQALAETYHEAGSAARPITAA